MVQMMVGVEDMGQRPACLRQGRLDGGRPPTGRPRRIGRRTSPDRHNCRTGRGRSRSGYWNLAWALLEAVQVSKSSCLEQPPARPIVAPCRRMCATSPPFMTARWASWRTGRCCRKSAATGRTCAIIALLGYGFAMPYLGALAGAERAIAAMPARQGVMAWPEGRNAAVLVRGRRAALSGCVLRPHPDRAWPGSVGASAGAAAPALAGAGAGRAHPAGGAQPRQPVGPGAGLALRPWPALFADRAGSAAERRAVRAGPLVTGALCAAFQHRHPLRHRLGESRRAPVPRYRRGASGGGGEVALCRRPAAAAGGESGAEAGAGS